MRTTRHSSSVLGIRVPKAQAEALRKELASSALVNKSRAIITDGDHVVIPLLARPPPGLVSAFKSSVIDADFPLRRHRTDPIDDIRGIADVPDDLRPLLPGKWELFGDVGVIRLDPRLEPYAERIAPAYASVLGLRAVLQDVGGISGDLREPVTRKLLGEDTVTRHIENGIVYKFDAARIMFSSGNMEERLRMAGLRCDGETVVDMFAGIGYFSLPLAVYQRPRKVVACEINSVAHSFLVENVALNSVKDVVEPFFGDNRELKGESMADRVIMGYVKTTHEYLPTALRLVKDGGIIHYHETCPNELLPHRPTQRLVDSVKGGGVEVLRFKEVKSYAPGISHVVVDARVFKPS